MTYAEAVRYLYSLGNEIQTAKFDLDRIRKILKELGDPHLAGRIIHVAGTNGKGSTSAMIESGLRGAGQRTGLYTSPHLSEPTERIRILGEPVAEAQFAAAFTRVHQTAGEMLGAGLLDFHPTYFESVTAMAFVLFAEAGLDRVVLETGMGGRLDATNVVNPELCVITPIDFDHQFFLGDTIGKIAREKAGILKPGVRAVFSRQSSEAAVVLENLAQGPFEFGDAWAVEGLEMHERGSRFRISGLKVTCPLAGEHQVENARTAAIVLHRLGFGPDGIANTRWPGRLEHVADHPAVILDGAHNIAGTRALVDYLQRFYGGRRIWMVYGAMRDKAVAEIAALLFPLAHRVILTAPANSRAMRPDDIPAAGATITPTVADAVKVALQAAPNDVVLITGSLFVVGEARRLLLKRG